MAGIFWIIATDQDGTEELVNGPITCWNDAVRYRGLYAAMPEYEDKRVKVVERDITWLQVGPYVQPR